jgi:hypothetical protein
VERKRAEVRQFLNASAPDAQRQELLQRYGVAYVLVGPNERALAQDTDALTAPPRGYDPDAVPYLVRVYDEGGYALYRVVPHFTGRWVGAILSLDRSALAPVTKGDHCTPLFELSEVGQRL